jgi:hypothetical protein
LFIKTLDPDPNSLEMLDPDPDLKLWIWVLPAAGKKGLHVKFVDAGTAART